MATDVTRIVVAQMARVFLAPVGTTAPTTAISALAAGWVEVGLFTPDSLAWATDPTFEEVRSHQSNFPTRRYQTADTATMSVDLQEWSGDNFKAVYGGGTIVETGVDSGFWKYSPPAVGARVQTAAVVQITDGSKHYRRVIPLCEQSEGVSQTFNKSGESTLPLRLTVLGGDVGDAWYDITDDDAFEVA